MKIIFITNVLTDYVNREPLGIMYLSSALKKAGHEIKVESADYNLILKTAGQFKPDILAYSLTTGFHKMFLELNLKIREKLHCLSVFGGPHATFFPQIIEDKYVDAVCLCEGEEAFVKLVNNIENKKDIKSTENFWIKVNGNIYKNEIGGIKENIDMLPFPDRELIYERYESAKNAKIKQFINIRGCPYKCSYCFNDRYNQLIKGKGNIVRIRSVDNFIEEVLQVKSRYPLELAYFVTDNFVLASEQWMEEFAKKYKKEVNIPFHSLVRPNMVTAGKVTLLKEAGCVSVMMGIEAGNEKLRNEVLKRNLYDKDIYQAADLLKRSGIKVCSQNMLGIPGGNLENDIETYIMNRKCKVDYAVVSILNPYPGTEIHSMAVKMGLYHEKSYDDIGNDYYETSPLNIKDKNKVRNLQKLLAVAVLLKIPVPALKIIISFPFGKFYSILYKIWKGYAGVTKIFPHKLTLKEYIKDAYKYVFKKGPR